MNKIQCFNIIGRYSIRKCCSKVKLKVFADEEVLKNIDNNVYKPKHHPGINNLKTVILPEKFIRAAEHVFADYPIKAILESSKVMSRHLKGRVPPMERDDIIKIQTSTYEKVLATENKDKADEKFLRQNTKDKVISIMKKKIYNWSPMTYDAHSSLVYLMGRSAAEYAVINKIFSEINNRDGKFSPKSFFDFGSGVGTATWAATAYWKRSIFEYFNVDMSSFMNDLALLLLQGGVGTKPLELRGVFFRQFLPSKNTSYDLVVSAYSLLELPSAQSRMETVLNLWNKTAQYLVLIEQGTNAGFRVINEARDFILEINDEANKGHVFSPCPHDNQCPRYIASDNTPCNFEIAYMSLPIGAKSEHKKELYSYVVLKKGLRNEEDMQWPRVIRETLIKPRHTICRVCTKNGELQEFIFTKSKPGKTMYHCARSTKWGDLLPITLEKTNDPEETQK